MIRINLLGQAKPKASRRQVDTGAALPVLFIAAGLVFGCLILGYLYYSWQRQLSEENNRIKALQAQKTDLEQIKLQVEAFEKQKQVLQQRVSTIEQLQRDRTGGQELLDQIANTVARTENLWLTSMVKKGNNLALEGAASSINGVANFVTALKRSGYFQKVEIRESKQDDKNKDVQTFLFQMTAEISPSAQTPAPAARPQEACQRSNAASAPRAGTGEERVGQSDGESVSKHVGDHAGLAGSGHCGAAGLGRRVRAGLPGGPGTGRVRQGRSAKSAAESGSDAIAGVPAALRRIEVANGCFVQAAGNAEDHRSGRKRSG